MVADDPSHVPDVWIVEFAENFDSSLEQYEALLALLLYDKARLGHPAVITAAVAKNFCLRPEGDVRKNQCGLTRTLPWLQVGHPSVSFRQACRSCYFISPSPFIRRSFVS
jgi:hypothetical protein